VILLPEQKTLTEPVLRDIFLHELAHLARRDCLFHLLARLATAVLFFQPLAWRLSRRLELIADDLCDDYVIHFGPVARVMRTRSSILQSNCHLHRSLQKRVWRWSRYVLH